MVRNLVDMSSRPDPSDSKTKVETDLTQRLRQADVSVSGAMVYGRAYHMLEAVDRDRDAAMAKNGAAVVAVVEEFRDRIRSLAKNPDSLKPAPAKRPEKIVCEIPRGAAKPSAHIRADARKSPGLKGGLSIRDAEAKLWKKSGPDIPDDYVLWNDTQILLFIAHADQRLAQGDVISDVLRTYSIPNHTYQYWRKNFAAIKARASGATVVAPVQDVADTESDASPAAPAPSAPAPGTRAPAASNGDARHAAPVASGSENHRDPRLPNVDFTGYWSDEQKLILVDLVLARQRQGISIKSTVMQYPVSEPTYYAWAKKRGEIEARVLAAAKKPGADAGASNGAPAGEEAANGTPLNGDLSMLPRDSRLPEEGFTGRWNDTQKLILIDLADAHGGQTGGVRAVLELYNVPYPTFYEWRRNKEKFERRTGAVAAPGTDASVGRVPEDDGKPRDAASPAGDIPPSDGDVPPADAATHREVAQTSVLPTDVIVEAKKRSVALDELGYFPEVLKELSESLHDPMLLTLATLVEQRYNELVARAEAASVIPEQLATPPADIVAAAETIVAQTDAVLEQIATTLPAPEAEPNVRAPEAAAAPVATVAPTEILTEAAPGAVGTHAPSLVVEAGQPSTLPPAPDVDAEVLRQRTFKNAVELKFNGRMDPNFTYESAVRVAKERCLAVGYNALRRGKAASGLVGVDESDLRSFLARSVAGILERFHPNRNGDILEFYREQLAIEAIREFGVRTGRAPEDVRSSARVHTSSGQASGGESLREEVVMRWAERNGVRNVYSAYDFVGAMMRRHMRWVYELSERLRRENPGIGDKQAVDQRGYTLLMATVRTYDFQDNVTHESFENELSPRIEAVMKGE